MFERVLNKHVILDSEGKWIKRKNGSLQKVNEYLECSSAFINLFKSSASII